MTLLAVAIASSLAYLDDGSLASRTKFLAFIKDESQKRCVQFPPPPKTGHALTTQVAIDHCSSPVLAHLEVHYSRLPRKGRRRTNSPHLHDDEEVIVVLNGSATFYTNGSASLHANGGTSTSISAEGRTETTLSRRGSFVYFPFRSAHTMAVAPAGSRGPRRRLKQGGAGRESPAGPHVDYLCIRYTTRRTEGQMRAHSTSAPAGLSPAARAWPTFVSGGAGVAGGLLHSKQLLLRRPHIHRTTLAAGASRPVHRDGDHDVLLLVLEGAVEVVHPGGATTVARGGLAFLPANTSHGVRNGGAATSQHLAIEFLDEVARGSATEDTMAKHKILRGLRGEP